MKPEENGQSRQIDVGPALARDAMQDSYETGTALDYLWQDQQGSVFEPVEPAHAPAARHIGNELAAETNPTAERMQPCLDSALKNYSSWLNSIGND
jgi:hypothetical protein